MGQGLLQVAAVTLLAIVANPTGTALAESSIFTGQLSGSMPSSRMPSSAGSRDTPVTFSVEAATPTVTLNQPASPSKDTMPSFSGSASETTAVTVDIYVGATVKGSPISTATATGTGAGWESGDASPALRSGQYTATASQQSPIGNVVGTSSPVTFTVDTAPPTVTLTPPPSPSSDSTPSFTGSASDTTEVTVDIYAGATATGPVVATAKARGNGGIWHSEKVSHELTSGQYAATATQPSSLGNPAGTSSPVTFKVDTAAPTVTLTPPPSPSSDSTRSFTGSASDETPVTVDIYAGATATGPVVATATATGTGGGFSSGDAQPALSDGHYTATATQTSLAGHTGTSPSVTFTVDTMPPRVTVTLPVNDGSTSGGSQLVEGEAGTAEGDTQAIRIKLFAGATVGSEPVQQLTVQAAAGAWSATFAGLSPGVYTAQSEQADEAGNIGRSEPVTFTVTAPPAITPPAVAVPVPPVASFTWFPSAPDTGEPVLLESNSADPVSPITGFAWALTSNGPFQAGGSVLTTSFATPGAHAVRLQVTNAFGLSSVATETINLISRPASLMQPFPIVQIAGTETASGVELRLLRVQQMPAGAVIAVRCKGRGCPFKSARRVAKASKRGVAPLEFHGFERFLRSGVTLEILVSKPGEIGEYTRLVVRRGKLPERVDMCLNATGIKPQVCPSS